jgi:hypothetical protein
MMVECNNGEVESGILHSDDKFPLKLHKMLEDLEKRGQQHLISWHDDGRSFVIHEPKVFACTMMQNYFRQTHYKSFQRQLNLYAFKRASRGPSRGVICKYEIAT